MFIKTDINIKNKKVKIHYLGKHYANKSSTKLWYFYGINLTNLNLNLNATYKGVGDNTIGEKKISTRFVSHKKLNKSNDALSLATYGKLNLKNLIRTCLKSFREIVYDMPLFWRGGIFINSNLAKNSKYALFKDILFRGGFVQKVDRKDIAWLLRCKECSKTLKIKDVKETIKGDFKMCDKHLEMIEKSTIKFEMLIKNNSQKMLNL